MLIRKVLTHNIDVVFIAHLEESIHQIRKFESTPRNLVIIIGIDDEEYSHDHSVRVAVLELGSGLQEFKTWMSLQQILKQWLEIIRSNVSRIHLCQQVEHPPTYRHGLALPLVVAYDCLFRYLLLVCLHFLSLLYALKEHLLEYFGDLHCVCTYSLELVQTHGLIRFTFECFLNCGFSLLLVFF